ncbi:hypothetical protein MMC20_007766 [Loxospora ochrophaea]|nr:hypothetical protein [Loxospora ochrophaea]
MDLPRSPSSHDGAIQGLGVSSTASVPLARLKQSIPKNIDVPSYSAFQAQNSHVQVASPVRRKPLPTSASPSNLHHEFPAGRTVGAHGEEFPDYNPRTTVQEAPKGSIPRRPWVPTPKTSGSPQVLVRDLDQYPRGFSVSTEAGRSIDDHPHRTFQTENTTAATPRTNHARLVSDPLLLDLSSKKAGTSDDLQRAATMSLHHSNRPAPLQLNGDSQPPSGQVNDGRSSPTISKPLKSLGANKLTSFFGWKPSASSPVAESPTMLSDTSHSPSPSPNASSSRSMSYSGKSLPHAIDVPRANARPNTSYFVENSLSLPPPTPAMSVQIEEMEEELREVSAELAGSIRREMELEDQVERLQLEAVHGPDLNRRTSDYFSDSGTSSIRYPLSDNGGAKIEDFQKLKRRSEQEKAQLKLDLSQKLQDERGRRKALEVHIRSLEEHVREIEQQHTTSLGATNRVPELEAALEDNRRRLLEERQVKENFEDLLAALREEIERHRNERDNLRDEVVPQLRARLEGLEAESVGLQKLAYENTRMQQEIQSLRYENTTLMNTKKLQVEMQNNPPRFDSIAEEESNPVSPALRIGLSRSNSVARGNPAVGGSRGALSRSNSVSIKDRESRESLADRVKDIEMQRDALHSALKNLLERQNFQTRDHEKRVRVLEMERDKALQAQSPRRMGYEKEVSALRHEINHLRRRADEALEQKWQCEKGLGGLKKDLDRAEQETGSLRALLQEHDVLVPDIPASASRELKLETYATSSSLEKAYKELQASQSLSIAKLRDLKGALPSSIDDASTAETMDLLVKSMSDAEAERDFAQKQAAVFRAQAESLQQSESFHVGEKEGMADQLKASANRVEALATQVRTQLDANSRLRTRLAEAVGRGEREQKTSATRINTMQSRLKSLEERLMTAQQHSEEAVQVHEDEVKQIQQSQNAQLHRLKGGLRTPIANVHGGLSPQRSPLSPFFGARSPRLEKTTSGVGISMTEATRTEFLERRVQELEKALAEADGEMEEVVQRMNMAQIEVMELQSARDDAMRQTKRLQSAITAEREKVDSLMT